jgi:hypothetical protein
MKLISHRGNIDGRVPEKENNPSYIKKAVELGYDVEVDVWMINKEFFLGHDKPQYKVHKSFFLYIKDKAWIHCKNLEALNNIDKSLNYFWHQNDDFTLTSKGFIWTYPEKEITNNSVIVLKDNNKNIVGNPYAVCTDFVKAFEMV